MLLVFHFFGNTNYIIDALKSAHQVFVLCLETKKAVLIVLLTILLHDIKGDIFLVRKTYQKLV